MVCKCLKSACLVLYEPFRSFICLVGLTLVVLYIFLARELLDCLLYCMLFVSFVALICLILTCFYLYFTCFLSVFRLSLV